MTPIATTKGYFASFNDFLSDTTFAQKAFVVLFSTALLTISAKVSMPFWPVNVTLQSLTVLMLGFTLGRKMALAVVVAYLLEGAAGLPVFTGTPARGTGIAYMMGPTGGYLLGFAVMAYVSGWFADKNAGSSYLKALGAAIVSLATLYIPGVMWLATLTNVDVALQSGFYLFIPSAVLSAIIAGSYLALRK